jgi:hypothetical protein
VVQIDQKLHHLWGCNCTIYGAAILHGLGFTSTRTIGDFFGRQSTVIKPRHAR